MQSFLEPDRRSGGKGAAASGQCLRWTSVAMMGSAVAAFAFEGLAYNLVFLARVLPATGKRLVVMPCFLAYNALWVLAAWSYLQAHSRDPGVVPPTWHEFVSEVGDALPIVPALAEWQPGKATFCRKCVRPRPERAHHCCICDTCILRMDHHCPWIGNCIGFHNHKFFLLLGVYTALACCFTLATALPEAVYCLLALAGAGPADSAWLGPLGSCDQAALLLLCAIALAALLFLAHMLAAHVSLAARNATSIEDFYDNMPNPFDRGAAANLAELFGARGPDWLLPVRPARPLGDGVSFPRAGEAQAEAEAEAAARAGGAGGAGGEALWRRRYGLRAPAGPPPAWAWEPCRPCRRGRGSERLAGNSASSKPAGGIFRQMHIGRARCTAASVKKAAS